jgi:hypothetical protein
MNRFCRIFCSVIVVSFALSSASSVARAQAIQFVAVDAPPPLANNCTIDFSQTGLNARLNALGATGQPPSIDFKSRVALVVTTLDANAVPNQMGPSAANAKVLLLTFNRGASVSKSGVFVFAVDASFAKSFAQCRVNYGAQAAKAAAPKQGASIHTSSRPQ